MVEQASAGSDQQDLLPGSVIVPPAREDLMRTLWDFFGQPLDAGVVASVVELPADHAARLAEVVMECHAAINQAGVEGNLEDTTVNEQLVLQAESADPADVFGAAKLLSLYTRRTLLATELFSWAATAAPESGPVDTLRLQHELRHLLALQPLYESGALVAVPPPDQFEVVRDEGKWTFSVADVAGRDAPDPRLVLFDPLIARYIIEPHAEDFIATFRDDDFPDFDPFHPDFVPFALGGIVWPHFNGSISDMRSAIPEMVERVYQSRFGARTSFDDIAQAVRLYALQFSIGGVSLTGDRFIHEHLTGIYRNMSGSGDHPSSLAGFSLPGTRELTIEQIATLRKDVEVFESLRSGLRQLVDLADASPRDGSFRAFEDELREAAEDVLGPLHDQLTADLKRGRFATLAAEWGTRLTVSISLWLAGHFGVPVAPLAGPASAAVGTAVAKHAHKGHEARRLATRLTGLMVDR